VSSPARSYFALSRSCDGSENEYEFIVYRLLILVARGDSDVITIVHYESCCAMVRLLDSDEMKGAKK
jgi:hypothetical protein